MCAQGDRSEPGAAASPADVVIVGDLLAVGIVADVPRAIVTPDGSPADVERSLRDLRVGVVVVTSPPADQRTIRMVARIRGERPGVRAVLIDPAAAHDLRLEALKAGFDEALPTDLGADEIVGRIAIQLDRARAATSGRIAVGVGVELDLEARALRRRGRLVHLRPLEFRLLDELARAPGRPLSRAWLIDRAWGAAPPVGSRTVDVHIRWLREKVERDPDRPVHLLTVRGVGYRLEPRDPDDPDDNAIRGMVNRPLTI